MYDNFLEHLRQNPQESSDRMLGKIDTPIELIHQLLNEIKAEQNN